MEKIELLKVKKIINGKPQNGCTMNLVEVGEEVDFSDSDSFEIIETFAEFESLEAQDKCENATEAPLEALKKYQSCAKISGTKFSVTEYVLVTTKFDSNNCPVRSILIAFANGLAI